MNFTLTYVPPTYTLTITVTPADATVKIDGVPVEVVNGSAVKSGLVAGNYTIEVSKDGYDTETKTITLTGDATETFSLKVTPPTDKDYDFGPWADFAGWTLEVVIDGVTYTGVVNETGYVTLTLPADVAFPDGTEMNLTKAGEDNVAVNKGEAPVMPKADDDEDGNLLLIIIIVIIVVIIIVILIVVLKGKKEPEVPPELEEELEEGEEEAEGEFMEEGGMMEEDMEDIEEGPESIEDFEAEEPEEEMEGVDEMADEMEDFEDDIDEDFDEELDDDFDDDLDDDFDDDL
jgi:hypothetical protein